MQMWCVTASSLGFTSTDVIHVSFVKPPGMLTVVHSITFFSGRAGTRNSGPRTIEIRLDLPAVGRPIDRGRRVLGVALRARRRPPTS